MNGLTLLVKPTANLLGLPNGSALFIALDIITWLPYVVTTLRFTISWLPSSVILYRIPFFLNLGASTPPYTTVLP